LAVAIALIGSSCQSKVLNVSKSSIKQQKSCRSEKQNESSKL